ncbi:MAG TPA: DeoR/GlpR family DNA-binding transcription regulator [Oceanipulchritudo sp.]|nr:DeoR/GlpR family DNA-binding transcription regulator [Oceanipulchritudo sp.]
MMEARHQKILTLLGQRGSLPGSEIARIFGVTPMTAWRDMKTISELGLAMRVRGGLRKKDGLPGEPVFEQRRPHGRDVKTRIACKAVSSYIREGMVLAMEGGTTVEATIPYLPEKRISIITNSLPVAIRLREERPQLPVQVVGGWLSPVSGNLTGANALRETSRLRADICFISASGFDTRVGPSDPNPLEIEVKRALVEISRQTILLLESRKFGLLDAAVTLHPRRLHGLVSEVAPPEKIASFCRGHTIRITVASLGDAPQEDA